MLKICKVCKESKDVTLFASKGYFKADGSRAVRAECKKCYSELLKAYRKRINEKYRVKKSGESQ